MNPRLGRKRIFMSLLALMLLLIPAWGAAQASFERIVVFGTSLSDPGNAFALTGRQSTPPYDTLDPFLVPGAPYARGGHHFSNGATWIEQFARQAGLAGNARPAFQASTLKASNYAVGGARAREVETGFGLSAQVGAFLADFGGAAPSDALYVVEFGGNDVRDALAAFAGGGNAESIIAAALTAIAVNVGVLHSAGARHFLVWNVPDIGLTPAVRILDSLFPGAAQVARGLTLAFNSGLDATLLRLAGGLAGMAIARLDVHRTLNDVVANPATFGLREVQAACVTPRVPPFACQTPDEFLFWDGIHPTRAAHAILGAETASALALRP